MSRVGKKPITVPAAVKVAIKNQHIDVTGPKGTLAMDIDPDVKIEWNEKDKVLTFGIDEGPRTSDHIRAMRGTSRALLQNAINGVQTGYEKALEVVGVGWVPSLQGQKLKLVVGFANPIILDIPKGLTVTVDKQIVKISGPDRQLVGQFAAQCRSVRKPEPYNGKGIKYTTETIKRKQGKQFGA